MAAAATLSAAALAAGAAAGTAGADAVGLVVAASGAGLPGFTGLLVDPAGTQTEHSTG